MKKVLLGLSLVLFTNFAQAGIHCTGTVDDFTLHKGGWLEVDTSWNSTDTSQQFCNVTSEWKGVNPEVCKAWVATIMSAEAQGTSIKVYYPTANSCNSSALLTNASTIEAPSYIRTY